MATASLETTRRPLAFPSVSLPARPAETPARLRENSRCLTLARGQVFTIPRRSGVRAIEVLSGTIWLTATPADQDILMSAGDLFPIGPNAPYVLEALTDAEFILHR